MCRVEYIIHICELFESLVRDRAASEKARKDGGKLKNIRRHLFTICGNRKMMNNRNENLEQHKRRSTVVACAGILLAN